MRVVLRVFLDHRRVLARHRAVIVALADHRARIDQHRDQPLAQRLRGHRLEQEFVDAELHRLDDARAFAVAGQHDDRYVGVAPKLPGERTMRMKQAPSSPGISQSRITTSGALLRISSSPREAAGGLVDVLHADAHEHGAHHFAHVLARRPPPEPWRGRSATPVFWRSSASENPRVAGDLQRGLKHGGMAVR